jgi:hypothetical protein
VVFALIVTLHVVLVELVQPVQLLKLVAVVPVPRVAGAVSVTIAPAL